MNMEISLERAEFNESDLGNRKLCCVVQFPNCVSKTTGQSFKWMPTYKQLGQIMRVLERVEGISWNKGGVENVKVSV